MNVGAMYEPKLCTSDIKMVQRPPESIHISGRKFATVVQDWIYVKIAGDEYEMCEQAGKEVWAAKKRGSVFKEGCANTKADPFRVTRTGFLGQMAFGKVFEQPVDLVYREFGDAYDNIIADKTLDIKCATRNYGMVLIRHSEDDWKVPLDKDIYVGGFLDKEDRELKTTTVVLTGYVTKEHIIEKFNKPHLAKKKNASHFNYEIPFNRMESIFELLKNSAQRSGVFQA
jgi:hypothetical protein